MKFYKKEWLLLFNFLLVQHRLIQIFNELITMTAPRIMATMKRLPGMIPKPNALIRAESMLRMTGLTMVP